MSKSTKEIMYKGKQILIFKDKVVSINGKKQIVGSMSDEEIIRQAKKIIDNY